MPATQALCTKGKRKTFARGRRKRPQHYRFQVSPGQDEAFVPAVWRWRRFGICGDGASPFAGSRRP